MPYGKFPEDGKTAIYKVDAKKRKVGKRLGLHDSPKKADAQIAALYANEKKSLGDAIAEAQDGDAIILTPDTYTISGGEINKAVNVTGALDATTIQSTLEFQTKDCGEMPMMVMPMHGPLTFAELQAEEAAREAQYEMYELTDQFGQLSRNIMNSDIEDKAAALVTLANEFATLAGEKVKEEVAEEMKSNSIAKQIAGDNQPEQVSKSQQETSTNTDTPGGDSVDTTPTNTQKDLFIWKEGDTYRWLAAYSNNRRDNDDPPEIISSESHKEFDQALQKGEWPMPELWVWHIPYSVGQTRFHAYDEASGFPIAGGVFNKGMEWVAEGLIEAGWNGVSHGMPKEWIQRSENDPTIITRHRTKEISILPQYAAANKLAFTIINKENEMADETKGLPQHKRDELVAKFGDKAQNFLDAVENTSKGADEAGIEKKEQPATEPTLTPDNPVVKALEMVVSQLTALDSRLKAIEDRQTEVEEKEQPFDLMEFLKSKSAIGQVTTKIDGRSTLAKDAPEQTAQPSPTEQATGIRLGLVDRLIQSNQAWGEQTQN